MDYLRGLDIKSKLTLQFAIFFLAGTAITLAAGLWMNFHVAGNDFWSPLYYGRNINWEEKESLYNGFYPIGYAFLVGQFPYTYAVLFAYILNALLAGLLTASIAGLVSATHSRIATGLAFMITVLHPMVFQYANTVGPDIGAAAFTAFAVYLLWHDNLADQKNNPSVYRSMAIGTSLGMAVLWRNHAIVSSFIILLVYLAIAGLQPIKPKFTIFGTFLVVVMFQLLANLLSGHGLFETTQNFNIYKLFYGVDWTNPPAPAELEGFSFWQPLLNQPREFFSAYFLWYRYLATSAWPGLVCILVAPWKSPGSRFGIFSVLVILLYGVPLALGDSLRAPLTTIGIFISSLGIAIYALHARIKILTRSDTRIPNLALALITLAAVIYSTRWFVMDWEFLRSNRAEHRIFLNVAQTLQARGMDNPDQVFADRLDFYLPNLPPYLPRQIEGFFHNWVWGYSQEYPRLPNDSWEVFSRACREQGIEFMVLSPNSRYRGDYFPPIYTGEVQPETIGLRFLAQRGNMRIYKFESLD